MKDYSSKKILADRTGFEPATSSVTGKHSNQLNYRSLKARKNIVFLTQTDTSFILVIS